MLQQYEVLEKRFGLDRHVAQSRWGKGIGEHYSLRGRNRGYPLSLYSHFRKSDRKKVVWTSLVFEALFAEDLELRIEFEGTDDASRFERSDALEAIAAPPKVRVLANADLQSCFADEAIVRRLESFGKKERCGAISLSKGFVEYREVGVMDTEDSRLRFQEAILLLASLCDAVSLYMSERKGLVR